MPDDDAAVSGDVVDTAYGGPGEWLPAAEAARRIGVSERTLWRYVDAGRYRKQTRSGRAQVWVPLAGTAPDNPETAIAMPVTPDVLSVAIIEELRRQHEESSERLTRQAARIEELERQTGKLEAELDQARNTVARMQSYSWWKRLFGYN